MVDVRYRRNSGETCYLYDGSPMIWNGHLCEGAQMISFDPGTFIMWTRCGKHDVPANGSHVGSVSEVTCPECIRISEAEEGQPVGSAAPEDRP
jgi:hypothetical protein